MNSCFRALTSTTLLLASLVGTSMGFGCGTEPPAITVVLVLLPANTALKTEDVTQLIVDFNGTSEKIALNASKPVDIAFEAAPTDDNTIVVYACETPAGTCRIEDAVFVGCDRRALEAQDDPVAITVFLDAIGTPPENCDGLL